MADMDDVTSDKKALDHLQVALKECILALNMEPDSWDIANAVKELQNALGNMRFEIRFPDSDDDTLETPAITEAAQVTLKKVSDKAAAEPSPLKKFFWTI